MSIVHSHSCLALKGVVMATAEVVGVKAIGEAGEAVGGVLRIRFTDLCNRLAVRKASRLWRRPPRTSP